VAFNAGDIEATIALCDPAIVFRSVFAAVGGAVYHGHDGMRRWNRDFQDVWGEDIRIEPEAYLELGENTAVFYLLHGRGQGSGVEVAMPVAMVARWREGLATNLNGYSSRKDALSDLGVSEDELERIDP